MQVLGALDSQPPVPAPCPSHSLILQVLSPPLHLTQASPLKTGIIATIFPEVGLSLSEILGPMHRLLGEAP